jgi:tetratricopeptide (TPR) repeat protein
MPSEPPDQDHTTPHPSEPNPADSLESVLDRYMEELAQGGSPDQERYIREHPSLADALRGVFKTLEFVEATSRSLNAGKLETGQMLGEYRIVREVGRGGMGVVYEAVQTSLHRRVALKVLPPGALLSPNAPERFVREAETAGRLHHTNIVPVHAVGEEQGIRYYVMQYIEGRSLSDHLRRLAAEGTPPGHDYFRRVARWGRQVADALEYAHREGIIHRDVKPSNLLLDARDNVWITDFGLARADACLTITVTGDVIGTARYMSPEQARGGRVQLDGRTDIYSLGAALYELLALRPAFDGDSREAVLTRIAFSDPKPLRQVNPTIPRDLETIVGKCMQKDPDHRYARAADVAEDCRRFLAGESILARRTPLYVKIGRFVRRHRVHVAAALLVLALLTTSIVLRTQMRQAEGQRSLQDGLAAMLLDYNPSEAARHLDRADALGVHTAELFLGRGLIPLLTAQPQRAIEPLTEALRRSPNHVEACQGLAFAYFEMTDDVNGLRFLRRHDESRVHTALGWLLRGHALTHLDGADPIACYDRALDLQADFTPAIEARATFRRQRLLIDGDRAALQPMLDDFDAWVVFRPKSARAYAARATGYLFAAAYAATQPDLREYPAKWLDRCRDDLDRALQMGGDQQADVYGRRGILRRYLGDYAGAAEDLARAVELDRAAAGTEHPGFVHHRVIALHEAGDVQTALSEITPACAEMPSFYPLALQRAILLAEVGRVDEARAACRETLLQHRTSTTAILIAAGVAELLGDSAAAAAALEDARQRLDSGPPDPGDDPFARPCLDYMSGRIDAETLLGMPGLTPGVRCMMTSLIAMRELGRGNRAEARSALDACLGTGVFVFIHYRFAEVLHARLRADPAWPAWIEPSEGKRL